MSRSSSVSRAQLKELIPPVATRATEASSGKPFFLSFAWDGSGFLVKLKLK